MHPEGYIKGTEWHYYLKDHLGNTRVDFVVNNTSTSNVQDYHYYPFGMDFTGLNVGNSDNKYKYNGKELQGDHGLDWYDYGARFYDAALGRWHCVDPLAEKFYDQSPYNYVYNNPMINIDPDGRSGIGVFDEETGTITVSMNIVFYGDVDSDQAAVISNQMQSVFNQQEDLMMEGPDGNMYPVSFSVTGAAATEGQANEMMKNNEGDNFDASLNFVRVNDNHNGLGKANESNSTLIKNGKQWVSAKTKFAPVNSFVLSSGGASGATTPAHELFAHGLVSRNARGQAHNSSDNGAGTSNLSIRSVTSTQVSPQFRDTNGNVNRDTRAVRQDDVNLIRMRGSWNNNRIWLGGSNNVFFDENSAESRP